MKLVKYFIAQKSKTKRCVFVLLIDICSMEQNKYIISKDIAHTDRIFIKFYFQRICLLKSNTLLPLLVLGTTHSSYPNSTKKAGQPEHYAGSNQGGNNLFHAMIILFR